MESVTLNELSLNVLDIAVNSVKAGASLTEISVSVNTGSDSLEITVRDNGCGFDVNEYEKCKASAPKISGGQGLILFKESAEKTGGSFELTSEIGAGTLVKASYILSSPNRAPLGDMAETVAVLALCKDIETVYTYAVDGESFTLDTAQIGEILGAAAADIPEAAGFIKDYIRENTDLINKNRIF